MTTNLNFEAESFDQFGSHNESSQEYENPHDRHPAPPARDRHAAPPVPRHDHRAGAPAAAGRDHRAGAPPAAGRDHRAGAPFAAGRDHRAGAPFAAGRDHRAGAPFAAGRDHRTVSPFAIRGRQGFTSPRGAAWRGTSAFSRLFSGLHSPGNVRGISGLFHGIPTRFSWNRGGVGGRPAFDVARGWFGQGRYFGDRGGFGFGGLGDFGRRWPWLSHDWRGRGWRDRDWRDRWRDGGMGMGLGSTDGGYQGPGYSGPDYSGGGSAGPGSGGSGYAGSGYAGPDSSAPDSSGPNSSDSGFAPGAATPAPGPGSTQSSDDPQIVAWAQGCLAQIVGGWVPQDGTTGRLTRRAVEIFQSQSQLPATGRLDDNTLSAIQHACHAITAVGAPPSPDQAPPQNQGQGPVPDMTSGPLPNVVAPDTTAGAPPAAPTGTGAPPPTPPPGAPPTATPSTTTPAQQPELPYWSHEYEQYENNPRPRPCEPDRCTSPYLRWLQNSLNQVFGQRLAITGTLDDPTIAAINRFRLAKRLRIAESYHVGPAIEDALRVAGAPPPPAVPPTQCGVSDPSKLIPILDQARGDIPLEFLLGWIDVESAWVLEPASVTCERGYFQLYPEDSVNLNLDHDRIGTDPAYSIKAGVPFVNWARRGIERAVKAFGVPRNGDLYWRLVKLWHWIPSGPEKILAAMSAQGARASDWNSVRAFVSSNFDALSRIIRRDPRDGVRSVDHMFQRVDAWRRRLHR